MKENYEQGIEDIKLKITEEKIKNIYMNFIGFSGNMYSKLVGVNELINNTHVSWYDGISINGKLIKDFETNNDAAWLVLLPNAKSFRIIPFLEQEEQKSAVIMCDIKNFNLDTRSILKKAVKEFYNQENLIPIIGTELIYQIKGLSQNYYYTLPTSKGTKFNNSLVNFLLESKIDVEYYMPYGKCNNRIDLVPDDAFNSADKFAIAKWFLESLALIYNEKIQFTNIKDKNISTCPIHISLWDKDRKRNLFFSEEDIIELSDIGRMFINGVLYYHKYIYAIVKSTTKQKMLALAPILSTRKG